MNHRFYVSSTSLLPLAGNRWLAHDHVGISLWFWCATTCCTDGTACLLLYSCYPSTPRTIGCMTSLPTRETATVLARRGQVPSWVQMHRQSIRVARCQ